MESLFLGHLAVWRHPAPVEPRARVLLVHGISEHSARHLKTVEAFNAAGFECVRFDLRGAGMSGGPRQYVEAFSDYVTDVATVFNWMNTELDPLPTFVMGHSLGGAISLSFARGYGKFFQGLLLSAPGFLAGGIPAIVEMAGRIFSRVLPKFRYYGSHPENLSRDPEVVAAYKNDPLSSRFNTLQQGRVILDEFKNLPTYCRQIEVPTIIAHGTADKVVLPVGSFQLLQVLASKDKELHYLPGVLHEPHLDWGSQEYFALLTRWIGKKLPNLETGVSRERLPHLQSGSPSAPT